jgi:hypothetical protein
MLRFRTTEILLVALFTVCVCFQLFVPPSIGLANNGDFGKMIGRFSLAPRSLDTSEEYRYFTAHWVYDRSSQWVSDDRSSELILISAAVLTGWWFSSHMFDIRILGAIQALLWIACFAAFLPLLRRLTGWRRYIAGIAALFIFTDVSYVAYCNSFYTDVAALLMLAWAVVVWLRFINSQRPSAGLFVIFVTASIFCVSSKSQHALLAMLFYVLGVVAALSFECRWHTRVAIALSLLIPLAAVVTFEVMPDSEKAPAQYAVIFMSILHQSSNPLEDARELGLGPEYLRYVDYWPLNPSDDPLANSEWRALFVSRTNYERIAKFYLRHPWSTLEIIYRVLKNRASRLRPELGNYEQKYGFPSGAETRSFGWWSALRSALFRIAPWHIAAWYAGILVIGCRLVIRPTTVPARISLFAVILAAMGLIELAVSSLADAGETERHLFLFHVITDFTLMLVITWAAWYSDMPFRRHVQSDQLSDSTNRCNRPNGHETDD